ncbi:MAG: M3 family oligoendopeptidase [Phycisphaerae bacterium]
MSDFDKLNRYQKRTFVPENANLSNKDQVVSLYEKLLARGINSAGELEGWLTDLSELESALDQEYSILNIRMTCQTDDPVRADSYKKFVETVLPAVKPVADKVNRKYLAERQRFELDKKRFEVYDRDARVDAEMFRKENVPLQTQLDLLSQEYQTVCGAMMVNFQGRERTLQQMSKFLYEPDRPLRESAWQATVERRLREKDRLEEIFDKMVSLRDQVAANTGCKNYVEYKFRAGHRFDYTPADCKTYHAAVARLVVPVYQEILKKRRRTMELETLRPWDTSVDPKGRPALKPFEKVDELIAGVNKIFDRIDPELGLQFKMIDQLGLLDLDSRKGKAPGGYQSTLAEARKPFIFMNAVGLGGDVETLLHEGGHAFHSLAAADEPLYPYRHAPLEFCEVASMGMELLGQEHLEIFYKPEELQRTRFEHLEGVIQLLPWVACVDSFQHWIYENPRHDRDQRTQKWLEIHNRFMGGVIDWTSLTEQQKYLWHRQLHIFECPFYYIEYGIAQLGALQLWVRAKRNPRTALADYRKALTLGGSRPLPELFTAAGLTFDFSEKTIAPLMDAVLEELAKL